MYSNKSNSKNVVNFIKRRKSNLRKVFYSKCCLCGFDEVQEALEFHHVNPENKKFGISSNECQTKALSLQLKEIKKCILVCANCHRGIHQGIYNVPKNWQKFYDESVAEELLKELENTKTRKDIFCQNCGEKISTSKAKYCSNCCHLMQRICERPEREEFKNLIRITPFTKIAEMFNVSDNTIRKWCDSYHLPRKKADINNYSDQEWEKI